MSLRTEHPLKAHVERIISYARLALFTLAVTGGVALGYLLALSGRRPVGGNYPALAVVVALGVWAAFLQPVPVRNRRSSISVALTEIPALLGMAFLTPWLGLLAVAVGYGLASAWRRLAVAKSIVNWVSYMGGYTAALVLYTSLLHHSSLASPTAWAVSIGAVALLNAIDLVLAIAGRKALDRRWQRPPMRALLLQGGTGALVCSVGGLVAVELVRLDPWNVLLFVLLAGGVNLAFRGTMVSGQRYANLEKLYEFTRHLGSLVEGRDVVGTVLFEARTLLMAKQAELVVVPPGSADGPVFHCSLSGEEPPEVDNSRPLSDFDRLVIAAGSYLFTAAKRDGAPLPLFEALAARGFSDALVAPLQRDAPTAGYLLVADRAFVHEGFKVSDLRFFEALTANAGVALRSSNLLEQLRHEAEVRQYQAEHDALTGLPNRAVFSERLDRALANASDGRRVAVMLVDLDGFKEVNDTLGHHTGDAILAEVAGRLAPLVDRDCVVCRLGGDEFAVLVPDATTDDAINAIAEEVVNQIGQPLAVDGLLLDVRASLGVAVYPVHGSDSAGLLRHADIAMYAAKRAGGGARFYDRSEDRSTLRRLRLATELRRAMKNDDLDVWYQPVVELATGSVVSCEALLRWNHDQFGPISPNEFVPVAESGGMIDELTWWVMSTALDQARSWRSIVPGLRVRVNLSARSLMSTDVARRLHVVLQRSGVDSSALTLELTESWATSDPQGSERLLNELRALGVNLSIDDYGTGFSQLKRLKDLPFHELKIDKSFVKEMTHNKGDEAIVRSTIELARNLGRTVTAEGVEDQRTLQQLAALGCDAAQGFFLARPLPAHECEAWLTASASTVGQLRLPRLSDRAARSPLPSREAADPQPGPRSGADGQALPNQD